MASYDSFEALWRRHNVDVWSYAARRLNPEEADDIVAETFLIAWRSGDAVGRPWLLAVARNVIGTRYRARERHSRLIDRLRAEPAAHADQLATVAVSDPLVKALERLEPDDLEALLLIGWDDLTSREAAQVVGLSPSAFRMRLMRARRKLSAHLANLNHDLEPASKDATQ